MATTLVTPDTSEKKPKPARVQLAGTNYHRLRKAIHLACFAVFVTLPLLNVMRFDIPRQRFYFFGAELWISEFSILFFSMMFLLFLVAAIAMLYGRVYCSYLCPQMIFSEASVDLENRLHRWVNRKLAEFTPQTRKRVAKSIFFAILAVVSVFLAFVFISYFVEPRDLVRRLLAFDIRTAGGIAGASTTLLTLLDFAFLRQRFCTTVCPYGYLQGILADKNTLLVHYRDETNACIRCLKCVRDCPMGIDIRDSAHQIECTHCAECIDACSLVMGKLGKGSLIHYAWGETGHVVQEENKWWRKLGLRDGKRVVVLLVLLFYASGLYVAIAMRRPVLVRVAPDRTTLYTIDKENLVHNRFRLETSNRGHATVNLSLAIENLPGARLAGLDQPLALPPGATVQREFDLVADAARLTPGVNYIRIVATVTPGKDTESFPMTFITPMESPKP